MLCEDRLIQPQLEVSWTCSIWNASVTIVRRKKSISFEGQVAIVTGAGGGLVEMRWS